MPWSARAYSSSAAFSSRQTTRPRAGFQTGFGQPGVRVQPLFPQPLARQIEPAVGRVLAHVPGDVGQLHGHAEITGTGEQVRVAHPHQEGHHGPDGGGDPGGIGVDRRDILVPAALRVPGKTFNQRIQ